MEAIENAYGDEIKTYHQERDKILKEYLDPSKALDWDIVSGRPNIEYQDMIRALYGDESKIDETKRKAVKERITTNKT